METIIAVDTAVLALFSVLLVGLLRSHAEILRRLESHPPEAAHVQKPTVGESVWTTGLNEIPSPRHEQTPAFDIVGETLEGAEVKLSVHDSEDTLVAFLSSGCLTCQAFWEGLTRGVEKRLPGDARIVVVTKDSSQESPSRLLELAPRDVPVVMSSETWNAYKVEMSPYFIYVDGAAGKVMSEGSATTWEQVISLLRDSFYDLEIAKTKAEHERERGIEPAKRLERIE